MPLKRQVSYAWKLLHLGLRYESSRNFRNLYNTAHFKHCVVCEQHEEHHNNRTKRTPNWHTHVRGMQETHMELFFEFDVQATVHRDKFLQWNQLDALISQIYFWNKTLRVSDSSSVHRQTFFTVHTAVCHTGLLTACEQAVCTVKNSWRWTEELSETCRVLFQK